ncbi:MAG: PaaI family thioesterase [Planctomycetes bacterium]|nr:PaaI family thioesterase [Planctomycetota bacterium]
MDESLASSAENDPLRYAQERSVPFLELLGIEPVLACDGKAVFRLTVEQRHLRTLGLLHGGVTATLLDTAMGFAAVTKAPPGHHVVTVQLNMNFLRTVRESERLEVSAVIEHSGRKTAVAQAEIRNGEDKLVALGTATFMYLPIPADASETNPGENCETA